MRIYDGKTYRDATPEEIAEIERHRAEQTDPEPTPEERIAALEQSISSLKSSFSKFEAKLKYLNL